MQKTTIKDPPSPVPRITNPRYDRYCQPAETDLESGIADGTPMRRRMAITQDKTGVVERDILRTDDTAITSELELYR